MKTRLIAVTLIFASSILLSACGQTETGNPSPSGKNPLSIVTTLSIFQEMAGKIAQNTNTTIQSIIPSGAEPHDFEPTPQDILALKEADLFIYNGLASIEPWLTKTLPFLPNTTQIDLSKTVTLRENDPHYWLDIENDIKTVDAIQKMLSEKDPANKVTYEKNAQNLKTQLRLLDTAYATQLKTCEIRTIVTAHDAYGYLAARYNIETQPIAGLSPESEPDAKTIATIIGIVDEKKIPYILFETLASPKIAETIAEETGAATLVLNPIEGLTEEEKAAGKDFMTLMEENLTVLKKAMKCTM